MNDVSLIQGIIKDLHKRKRPDQTMKSVSEELAAACNLSSDAIVSWYYGRTERIPVDYVQTIAEYFDVDVLYLLGLQSEEKREETDTAKYIRMSEKSVSRIRSMTDQERAALESLLSRPTAFSRLLDTVSECLALPDKIKDTVNRLENTAPNSLVTIHSPANEEHGDLTTVRRLSEADAVRILRTELSRLESLLSQQRPVRMDVYDLLIGIIDQIAPRQDRPSDLIADAETILSRYSESATMTDADWSDLRSDLESFGIHLQPKDN